MAATVYFTKEVTPENIIRLYDKLGVKLEGKTAIKVHSGEEGNQNYLHPEFWKPVVEYVGGTVVECNTAYPGKRNSSYKHMKLLDRHGWKKILHSGSDGQVRSGYRDTCQKRKALGKGYNGKALP